MRKSSPQPKQNGRQTVFGPRAVGRPYQVVVMDTNEQHLKSAHAIRDEVRGTYTTVVETLRLRKLNELVSLTRRMREAQRASLTRSSWGNRQEAHECERMVDAALAWLG